MSDTGVVPHHVQTAVGVAGAEIGERAVDRGLVRDVDAPCPHAVGAELAGKRVEAGDRTDRHPYEQKA